MDTARIIRQIVIEDLNQRPETVTKWRQPQRGIPRKFHLEILERAKERGLDLPFDALRKWPESVPCQRAGESPA